MSLVCKQMTGADLRSSGNAVYAAYIERSSAKSRNVFKLAHFALKRLGESGYMAS